MRHQALEDHAAGLVLVEAEIEKVAQVPATLRQPKADGFGKMLAGERVRAHLRVGRLMAQKRDDVARHSEGEPHWLRVLRGIDEFVDSARVEAGRTGDRDLCRSLEGELEIDRRLPLVRFPLSNGELSLPRVCVGVWAGERRGDRV